MRRNRGRTWRTALTCAALVGAAGDASAQSVCVAYANVGTWAEAADCKATVCSDGTQPAVLEFKDKRGNVLQSVSMEAAGCVSVPIPHDTASYDWKTKKPPPLEWSALTLPATLPGTPFGVTSSHLLLGGGTVTLGCLSTQVLRDEPAIAYAFQVQANEFDAADALVAPIIQSGPGTPVPPAVKVGSFVSLVHDGVIATIRSSLPDRFEYYVIDVDGVVIADLEAGLAAEVTHEGNGWTTVTTHVPVAVAAVGQTVTLRQKGRQDVHPAELNLEI
jgi:hypothetical protein